METLHTIKVVCNKDGTELIYNDVKFIDFEGDAEHRVAVLHLADGNTASFSILNWDFWDLTPQRGWNFFVD